MTILNEDSHGKKESRTKKRIFVCLCLFISDGKYEDCGSDRIGTVGRIFGNIVTVDVERWLASVWERRGGM